MKATRICLVVVLGLVPFVSFSAQASGPGASVSSTSEDALTEGLFTSSVSPGSTKEVTVEVEQAGQVVAVAETGSIYTIHLNDEVASPGSILQVYRRLPGARGTATYRSHPVWWEVGQLTVTAVGGGTAVATGQVAPVEPLPVQLDESGAPAGLVLIGDQVRATGALGPRPSAVRVTFERGDLFELGVTTLGTEGSTFFRSWLKGLKGMEGPIQIEIHPELSGVEVSSTAAHTDGQGRDTDYPYGPTPSQPALPAPDLYETTARGVSVPDGKEVMVVDSYQGQADTWHYVDPVRLAYQQGMNLAGALASSLRIPSDQIAVRVVPQARTSHDEASDVPGYESTEEKIRILASSIEYVQPTIDDKELRRKRRVQPRRPRRAPTTEPAEADRPSRRRRLLERPPEVSSNDTESTAGDDAG